MANYELPVSAPTIVDRNFTKPLLCGPGPCDVWPSVTEAVGRPIISPFCEEYFNVVDDIRAGLQYLFQTRNKMVFAMSGAGHSGMEAVISNLVAPNETLLIASRGMWDERANIVATRYGIKTVIIRAPMETTFSLDTLETALKQHKPTALFITLGDSSTGTIQNMKGLGDICHRYGTLLLVDTVVSIAAEPFFMDEWGVDAVYASSQKALSGPAGISPVAFSNRAVDKINNRKHEPPFYFDAKWLALQWNCHGNTRQYHHTLSPPLLWALRECLRVVINETLPKAWARHAATTAHFHRRIQQMPLQFLVPKPEERLVTVTTLVLPPGYDYTKFYTYIREKHNIQIFPGLGPTAGKALRIGLMGINSTIEVADAVADAMIDALRVKSLL